MDVCTEVGTGIVTTSTPVPVTSINSVQHQPGTGHFGKFGTTYGINPVPPQCDIKIRLILMRSDCELQIFTFRSEKWIGFLMQSKSDGIKSDLRIRWLKSLDFGSKSDDSAHRILKSKNSIGL